MTKSALKRRNTRKYFQRNGKQTKVVLGIIAISFLIALIIISKIIGVISSFNKPYAPDGVVYKSYQWGNNSTLNLVVKSKEIYLFSYNPLQKETVILEIPENTYVEVPLGFGWWPIGSVYKLGQSENPKIGALLLKESVSDLLGVPVDGYLLINGNLAEDDLMKVVKDLRGNPLLGFGLINQSKTDLSLAEYWNLIWGLKGVRFDRIKTVNLEQSSLTSWALLADGSRVLKVDKSKVDQFIQKQIEDSQLKDESLNIGIYNTTEHSGLAERAARLITNMGGKVAFTANFDTHLDKSIVLDGSSYTAERLKKLFAPHCLKSSPSWSDKIFAFLKSRKEVDPCLGSQNLVSSRAEVNILLGEDFFLRYNMR